MSRVAKLPEGHKLVKRIVCSACGANWFSAPAGRCPSCWGPVAEEDVVEMPSGVIRKLAADEV